jgi:ribosome-associated translation inhibitor RaiA
MNKNITFTKLDSSSSLEDYIDKKFEVLSKLIKNLDPENSSMLSVECSRITRHHNKGDVFEAKAKLVLPGKTFQVGKTGSEMHAVVDIVKDELKEMIEKYKEMQAEKRKK